MSTAGPCSTSVTWAFEAIGTQWEVDTTWPLDAEVQADVLDVVEQFDRTWSRFRDDSIVTAMAREPGSYDVRDGDTLLGLYDELHAATDGAVTPLVGRSLEELGYDAGYTLEDTGRTTVPDDWAEVRRDGTLVVDRETVSTSRPLLLDVGAAGKGLLVDMVASVLQGNGVNQATVDASGDLYCVGSAPIRVALEHPGDPTRAIGVVAVEPEQALCASAVNRRTWGDGLHHVVDGRTGRPAYDVVATWVLIDQSCMRADGLATAHFFADPEVLLDLDPHHFVRIHADGRVLRSPDLPGELFT